MARKSDFSPEEWKILVESAMMAALAVTAADPSGLWGALKEGIASARTIIGAAHDLSSAEVVRAVAADYETAEGRAIAREGLRAKLSGKKPPEIVTRALRRQPLSMPRLPRTASPSKPFCYMLPKPSPRLRRKGAFWVLAARK
jgi:hypothetical protein